MSSDTHPLLEALGAGLPEHVAAQPVAFAGQWLASSRRTYERQSQLGSGSGPYEEVVDLRWTGALTASEPIGGIAFLLTSDELFWGKTSQVSEEMPVEISLHAYADYRTGRATFTARLDGADLPGVPVEIGSDLSQACSIRVTALEIGRVACLARASGAAFFVLLLPGAVLKMGRKRLWHARDEFAAVLPPEIRELLTVRRSGSIAAG